jgi:hypothetical protein
VAWIGKVTNDLFPPVQRSVTPLVTQSMLYDWLVTEL